MKLAESDVSGALKDYMRFRGWRIIRHQVAMFAGAGERGMPDLQAIRYLDNGVALVLWLETKSPSDRRKCRCKIGNKKLCTVCAQAKWHRDETARGAVIVIVKDVLEFASWYESTYSWLHHWQAGPQLDLLAGAQS